MSVLSHRKAARGEACTVIDEFVFETLFGMDWKNSRPTKADFASQAYNLEDLEAGPSKGLLDPRLKKAGLMHLDISNNNLSSIDCVNMDNGFNALLILKARHNCIISPKLNCPSIKELNLSYNELVEIPRLTGMPSLEVGWVIDLTSIKSRNSCYMA